MMSVRMFSVYDVLYSLLRCRLGDECTYVLCVWCGVQSVELLAW